jgi:Pyruvate/2-oxoacid:ferredoxin oxidoreductase delta subunit
LAAVLEDEISHDQVRWFLSEDDSTSKDLWLGVKAAVREIERDDACLIFDDMIQEKARTDESEMIFWYFDHCAGCSVKGSICSTRFIIAKTFPFLSLLRS